ncbi:MAG TPA: molecular chaperone HtpG, partial [Tepidisphaeraceae bacterium]|nr:molecular chaperone HtpG [Tepidisphaeraceae bacterium]
DAERAGRGTDVILHLREDAREFLQGWRLKEIVHRYSDFIDHPVVLGEETLNSRQAIWLRSKTEIKPEEYNAFYKQLTRDDQDPLKTIHIAAEGAMEFRALLFIPSHRPWDWLMGPQKKSGIDLFVRRVLIMHECEELAPTYLRFIRGVVDSADLPLNVSRETLQHNPLMGKIKANVVNRVLKTLEEMKESEYETYLKFYDQFGDNLKEGVGQDWNNRQRIADLLLFESTKTEAGKFTTLAKYVDAMAADQKEIHYLIGETRQQLENSPYVESFRAKGEEVLLLTDPVDEYLVSALDRYKEKSLKAADRAEAGESVDAATVEKFKPVIEALKAKLAGDVEDIRLSARLKTSAACLVAKEGQMGAHMERLMARMGRLDERGAEKRILELNPSHPAVIALLNADDAKRETWGRILLDEAVIAEGSRLKDPAAFARRVNDLIAAIAAPASAAPPSPA